MSHMSKKPRIQLIKAENGSVRPATTSLAVADFFEREHKNVLQSIEAMLKDIPSDYRELNFQPTIREVPGPKGSVRKSPIYLMTRDGFSLLAMGFTGKKALEWKIAFINAFNQLEANELARQSVQVSRLEETVAYLKSDLESQRKRLELKDRFLKSHKEDLRRYEFLHGYTHLVPLFRGTHAAERSAMTLGFFLLQPEAIGHWYQVSLKEIGERLRLAYPRGVYARVKALEERGFLHMDRPFSNRASRYRVDTDKIHDDAEAHLNYYEYETIALYLEAIEQRAESVLSRLYGSNWQAVKSFASDNPENWSRVVDRYGLSSARDLDVVPGSKTRLPNWLRTTRH